MNINCPKHIDNLYSAFKKAYNFDIKQCIVKESHCDNFKYVGRLLTNDGFLDGILSWIILIIVINVLN